MDPSGSKCNENRRGPTTESCGTPHGRGAQEDMESPALTQKVGLPGRISTTPELTPLVPTQHSKGDIRISWSAVSNAAIKSKGIRMTLTRVSRQDKNSRKPVLFQKMTQNHLLKKEMAVVGLKFDRVVVSRAGFLIRGLTTACLSILGKVGEYRALFRPVRTDGKASLKSRRGTASLGDLEGLWWPTISSRTDMITG